MIHGNIVQKILGVLASLVLLLTISSSVSAAEPHENPEVAKSVFSGISLLNYYTEALDFVLQKKPTEVKDRLDKMPFANIPRSLEQPADNLTSSGVEISQLVVTIDENINSVKELMGQSRLKEATKLAAETFVTLSQAYIDLEGLQQAAETTGDDLRVTLAPSESTLRQAYNELLEMINRIRQLLDLYKKLLKLTEQLPTFLTDRKLLPTDITLEIEPATAFVGDDISFAGLLTAQGRPMAGREVEILLDNLRYATVETDAQGHYQGTLQVPYRYVPEINVQALYYPLDKDIGVYLAALSPVVKLTVLFYEATLEVVLEDKAYPGLETTLTGRFDYGQSPPLNERMVKVYLDDVLISEAIEQSTFSKKVRIAPETEVGEHNVTVSAAPVGRYASVAAGATLDVTKAITTLDMSLPRIALIPGTIGLAGKLHSELGLLNGASIKMGLGKSQVELASSENGVFDTKIGVGMGLGLFGSQTIAIQVIPKEAWNAPLVTSISLMMVNWVNCAGVLIVMVLISIYLPSILRRRLGLYWKRRKSPSVEISHPEDIPVYSQAAFVPSRAELETQEPRDRIFNWYRLLVRLIQAVTKALLRPQQTLREFAGESTKMLGPVSKYFMELTRMVERLLYSRYKPTDEDAEKSKQLTTDVEEGLKGEGI